MRAIKLEKVKLTNSQVPADFEFSYKAELLRMVEIIPEGSTISAMKEALKAQEVLSNASDSSTIFLEDSTWEFVRAKVNIEKWRFIAKELIDFNNAINDAKECEAPHLKQKTEDAETPQPEKQAAAAAA